MTNYESCPISNSTRNERKRKFSRNEVSQNYRQKVRQFLLFFKGVSFLVIALYFCLQNIRPIFFFCYIYGFLSEVAIPRHKFRQHHSPPGKTTLKPKTTHKRKKIKNFVNPSETFVKALAKTRYEYDF
jgi:hypothetical protein